LSDVSLEHAAAQLLIRLQLTDAKARIYCVTEPGRSRDSARVADALGAAMASAGTAAQVVDSSNTHSAASTPVEASLGRPQPGNEIGATIVVAADLLASRESLTAAAAADLVVLVARRGVTKRAEIDEARNVLAATGARLAAAVLLD
jgi:hypothetical protein